MEQHQQVVGAGWLVSGSVVCQHIWANRRGRDVWRVFLLQMTGSLSTFLMCHTIETVHLCRGMMRVPPAFSSNPSHACLSPGALSWPHWTPLRKCGFRKRNMKKTELVPSNEKASSPGTCPQSPPKTHFGSKLAFLSPSV